MTDATRELFTIGHSNQTIEELVARLRSPDLRIDRLVDVRSAPYSRFAPHFNRERLQRSVEQSGIAYAYAGDLLGGRPTDPDCYKDGALPDGKANFLRLVDYAAVAERAWFRRGIDRLIELAAAERLVLMCSEGDPLRCHRHHLLAKALVGRGAAVRHVLRDGRIEPVTFDEEAGAPAPVQARMELGV